MTIKDIARHAGVSLRELARRYEIPYRTMEAWASGQNRTPKYVLNMLSDIYNIPRNIDGNDVQ